MMKKFFRALAILAPALGLSDIALSAAAASYRAGVAAHGEEIVLSEAARDHIAGDGLVAVMNQAASEAVYDKAGHMSGFRLFEIDKGSVYDLVGLKDGDIVTHIDDEPLVSPERAVDLLRYVKGEPSFSYTVKRSGKSTRFKVKVGNASL